MNDARALRMVAWIALVLGGAFLAWTTHDIWPGVAAYLIGAAVLVVAVWSLFGAKKW